MSPSSPTVSVIMPCYNQGQYVEDAVESVLAQTYQPIEIILINDGSTDEHTIQLLQTYQKPHLSIIHTSNRGPSAARNTGIQQARGQYILPLDADDRIAPTFLEKTVPILESDPNIGIVYSQAELFGEQSGRFDLPTYNFPEILLGNMIFNTSLYRKADWEKVGGYHENMVWGWEDYDFWLSLIELGRGVVQIPEVLYFHREVPNSRSQQMTQDYWVKSYTQIFKNHPALYTNHIEALFQHLVMVRADAQSAHHRLHQAELQIQKTELQLQQAEARMFAIASIVKNSWFWRVKHHWNQFRKRLGLKVETLDPLITVE
ncbi:MAG: glycosyltransferase family 2 protein [Oscillatoriales cyanobacterium C42_A2020_001]|nr:glycosyltransferase family 2 protein [Leptolyngbyaceae cyanobacterium C42_A2020_001]